MDRNSIAYYIHQYEMHIRTHPEYVLSHFYECLVAAFCTADQQNFATLASAFPLVADVYNEWMRDQAAFCRKYDL